MYEITGKHFKNYTMEQAIEWTSIWAWWDFSVMEKVIKIKKMAKFLDSENF